MTPIARSWMVLLLLATAALTVRADDAVEDVKIPAGAERPDESRRPPGDTVVPLIVEATNAFRKENKLQPLAVNPQLTDAAQKFAQWMADNAKYGHTADGREPGDRAKAAGYKVCTIAENIAYQFDSDGYTAEGLAKGFTQGWIDSPPHRANMLHPHVAHIGVGVAWSADGIAYGVQLFGRPESMMIRFSVINKTGRDVRYTLGEQAHDLPKNGTVKHGICEPMKLRLESGGETFDVDKEGVFEVVTVKNGGTVMRRRR